MGMYSVPPEGNVFESINPRRHVLRMNKLRMGKLAIAEAACAIRCGHVSREAALDNTLPAQTRHIGDTGEH